MSEWVSRRVRVGIEAPFARLSKDAKTFRIVYKMRRRSRLMFFVITKAKVCAFRFRRPFPFFLTKASDLAEIKNINGAVHSIDATFNW